MTTIAYKDGIIASDSFMSSGSDMVIGSINKIISGPGMLAGASGHCIDCYNFLEWVREGANSPCPKFNKGITGILIKDNQKYYINKETPSNIRGL